MMHVVNLATTQKSLRTLMINALVDQVTGNTIEIDGLGPRFAMEKEMRGNKTHYRVHISDYLEWRDEITSQVFDVVVVDGTGDYYLESFGLCTKLLVSNGGTYVVRKRVPDALTYQTTVNGIPLTEQASDPVIAKVTSVTERQIVLDYKGRKAKFNQPKFSGDLSALINAIQTRLSADYPGIMVDPNDAEKLEAYLDKPNNGLKTIVKIESADDHIRLILKDASTDSESSWAFYNRARWSNGINYLREKLSGVVITEADFEQIVRLGHKIDKVRSEAPRMVAAELHGELIKVTTEGPDGSRSTCDIDPFTARAHPTVLHNGSSVRLQLDADSLALMKQLKTELNTNQIEATRRK